MQCCAGALTPGDRTENTPLGYTAAASRRKKRDRSGDAIGRPGPPWDNRGSSNRVGGALATLELPADGAGGVGWIWGCCGLTSSINRCYTVS